ncbi:MAG: type II secretion system F family protein [Opitutales bacterium]
MPRFVYKAVDANGKPLSGEHEAADRGALLAWLRSRRARPLSIQELDTNPKRTGTAPPERRRTRSDADQGDLLDSAVNRGLAAAQRAAEAEGPDTDSVEKASFSRLQQFRSREKAALAFLKRLMDLHGSGMPVGDAVRLLQQRLSDPALREIANALWRELSEGRTLADAMRRLPDVFPESVCTVVDAGEATGQLAPILEKVIQYLEERATVRSRLASGLAYPAFVASMALGVALLLVFYLLPRINGMLQQLGGEMNWSMRILTGGSQLLIQIGPLVAIGLLMAGIGLWQWRRTPAGREATDTLALRLPLFGPVFRLSTQFQLTSISGTLLASGINMTEALRLTEKTLQNVPLRARFRLARTEVNEGLSLSRALQRHRLLPDLAIDVLSVGENTGSLVNSLNEVATGFRRDLTRRLDRLTTLVTALALAFAFALVALVAIGMVSSVFQVSRTLSL